MMLYFTPFIWQAKVHDLYVRHTMNPFSKLRGPIKSRVFDEGIVEMAQSFNKTALAQIPSLDGSGGPPGGESSLAWM